MTNRSLFMLLLWFVIILIAIAGLFYLTIFTDATYYVQVDNARVTEITPRGGMYYRYDLPGFNDKGQARSLSFETSRILRDEAYLTLHVAPLRGVTRWEEVQPEDIPREAWQAFAVAE